MRTAAAFLLSALILSACTGEIDPAPGYDVQAYVPVYANPSTLTQVAMESAHPTLNAGKIYAYGNYIFQNELNQGIHIIDRSRAQPGKVAFLKVPYSTEIAVKGNYLYTNSVSDMLVIDISDPQNPVVVKRIKNAIPEVSQEYPPFSNVYFECVDPSKGVVVNWELKTVKKAMCRR
jgi:hypothetical protein